MNLIKFFPLICKFTRVRCSIRSSLSPCVGVLSYEVSDTIIQYPNNYTPGIYADGYIVLSFRSSVRPFVCSFVCSFVRSYFRHVCRICVKVLRQSFSSGVYLSNYLSESIHIWTIVTLEGWHSLHDLGPQGPCPGVGLEVKI